MIARLTKEDEELQSGINKAIGQNMVLKRKNDQERELLAESRKKTKIEQELKERVHECLIEADSGLGSLYEQLERARKEMQESKHWWTLATK